LAPRSISAERPPVLRVGGWQLGDNRRGPRRDDNSRRRKKPGERLSEGNEGIPLRIDRSRPPPFHEMSEASGAFERMALRLLALDPRFIGSTLFGKRRRPQYGIDALARHRDDDRMTVLQAKAWVRATQDQSLSGDRIFPGRRPGALPHDSRACANWGSHPGSRDHRAALRGGRHQAQGQARAEGSQPPHRGRTARRRCPSLADLHGCPAPGNSAYQMGARRF
jgi:hypothetical protein